MGFRIRFSFPWMAALCLLLLSSACQRQTEDAKKKEPKALEKKKTVKIYTHRHYPTDKALFARFQEKTGIRVEVVQNSADELLKRLEIQGKQSDADVLITVDAGRLVRAQQKGLLQPIRSAALEAAIPAHLRDPKGHWFGLTKRLRVLVYAKDRVKPADLSTYEALTEARWKGKILVRSSNNIYNQSLMASIIAALGEEKAMTWAKGVVANLARTPKGSDRGQIKAVAAGLGDIAIVNTYYIGLMIASKDPKEREIMKGMGVFFPNQGDRGAHLNVSGAGVARYAPNKEAAIRFIEFLASPEAQKSFAESNFEYPVHPKTPASALLKSWGDFKADAVSLEKLGLLNAKAAEIFDKAGWR
jgi:iron(III) transport system substrate-binding protein